MEPTILDFYAEVDARMRVGYPPARVDDILADKANGEGASAFTAYLAAREQARTDARVTLGYYPITATPAEGSIPSAGGSLAVSVTAAGNFTVVCPEGCSADPASGTSETTSVTIAADENTDPVARSFGVVFRSGNCTATANIPQDAAADSVTVTPATDGALAAGEAIDITVSGISPAGTLCTASSDAAWLVLSKTSDIGEEVITATAAENTGDERIGTITVTRGTAENTCVITQAAFVCLGYYGSHPASICVDGITLAWDHYDSVNYVNYYYSETGGWIGFYEPSGYWTRYPSYPARSPDEYVTASCGVCP